MVTKTSRPKNIIVRIRRQSGSVGGKNYYHHADVICKTKSEALKAAKEDRVRNWRWIDSFDQASKSYQHFEVLYTVTASEANNPRKPISKRQRQAEIIAARKAP